MFITNGDEIINLNSVRMVQCFEGDNPTIRLNIDENHFMLFRFEDEYPFTETKKEIIDMLTNISNSWKCVGNDMWVRIDKLQHVKSVGFEMRLLFDTGVVKTIVKQTYRVVQDLMDATRAIYFEED